MNIKQQRDLWFFVWYPVVGFTLAFLGFVHWSLALLIFPWSLWVQIKTSRILCPHCSEPVGRRKSLLGLRLNWWSPLTPPTCVHCGWPLKERSAAAKSIR